MGRRSVALAAAATLMVSAGCGGNAADEDGERTELRVGVLSITAVAPIYLTEDQGFFEDRGLDVEPFVTIAGYFTTEDFAADNPETADAFTEALNEGLDYAAENPDEVRRILGTYTDIDEDVVEAMRLPHFFTDIDEEALAHVGGLATEDGLIDDEPNLDELIR
ncbi:ABC transporter substrate-binding protein [Spiractinospora alimapuensis]|uniref:ABC transporter substrate-binding protein n=1 Tax=Spiractinospora alimapuensis TaxID=2820884 RepID=UPI001F48A08B|nr:ABC transporter substrate-binding protein [Spiractinospora alimapuensis]QVQ53562.1 ABC transporter substrate-binding protein [Spiractinospora alimapuensis]